MENSVYDLTAKLDYKPRLPARIKWWFRRRKYIKERARNGWSRYDVWDFDTYLATVISGALEFLAHNNMSHPYDITDEEWKEKLLTISDCFKLYTTELPCPSYEAYKAALGRTKNEDGSITYDFPKELSDAWKEEEIANYNYKMKKLKEGFDLLYEIYPNLWD